MNYWYNKSESEYYDMIDSQSEQEKIKCPICCDMFHEDELTKVGTETTHETKDTLVCSDCLEHIYTSPDSEFYPNYFLLLCRELKEKGELSYENVINKL